MFGRVVTEESYGDVTHVVSAPIRPITYDVVTNPSHMDAKVLSFLPENIDSFLGSNDNSSLLTESSFMMDELTLPNSNLAVLEYRDQLLKESFRNMGAVRIKF